MDYKNALKNHLKNFTVKELKQEVIKVKKDFQVSKLKRAQVEAVILKNHYLFEHLLKNKLLRKPKKINVLQHAKKLLKELDSTKPNARNAAYVKDVRHRLILQKSGDRYLVRDYDNMNQILIQPMKNRDVFEYKLWMLMKFRFDPK